MAEEDVMLVAIRLDAKGAIQDTEVLDTKFDKLGNTMRKGQERAEGAAQAQAKLDKSIEKTTKSTVESNVANISFLAATEAITSSMNQYISSKYKSIDADLAAGKISQEEAEQKRKAVKQQEKYTGALERGIAIVRFGAAAGMIFNAVQGVTIAGLKAQTMAVLTLNGALYANPLLWVVLAVVALVAVLYVLEKRFGTVTKSVEVVSLAFEGLGLLLRDCVDLLDGLTARMGPLGDALEYNPVLWPLTKAGSVFK
tara:strand:+ start:442 stop:1206 length:765 start_codon:yes stop_codon:yes gene_type:complete